MELRHLQEFISIIDHGSLSDAARTLGLPQPTLTRDIKLLESAVGGAVFVRTRYGMRLTPLGAALEPRARTIIGEVDRSRRELAELKAGHTGHVVVGTALGFAQAVLPRALLQFRRKHPRIQVTLMEGLYPDILPGLKAGDIDYAFLSTSSLGDADLRSEVLLSDEPVMVVTRRENPIAAKRKLSLRDIAKEPWAIATEPEAIRQRFEAIFARADLPTPDIALEFNSYYFAKRILREDNVLSIFSKLVIQDELDRKTMKVLHVPEFNWRVSYHAIFRRAGLLSPAAQALLAEIRDSCELYRRRRNKER